VIQKRPPSITVFAILNLVFGGLGLLCNTCGVFSLVANPVIQRMQPKAPGEPDMNALQRHMEAEVPGFTLFQWTDVGVGLILNIVLLSGGLGLLKMNASARWTCVGYSICSILFRLGAMVYNIAFVNPAVSSWMETQGMPVPPMMRFAMTGGSIFGALLVMTYAVVLLVFMLLPGTAKAFAGSGDFREGPEEDYYDPEFERQRRELPRQE
jgi:hypothetical protein